MIDPGKVRLMALTTAVEDYSGFYELIWELNGKYPAASDSEKLEISQLVLSELFDQGLVELFFAVWSPSSYDPIESDGPAVISHPSSWQPPSETPGATYYAFAANGGRPIRMLLALAGRFR